MGGKPEAQALPGVTGQLLILGPAVGRREPGQDGIALDHHESAAPGDVDCIVAGLGQVGEEGAHVRGRLEPVLRRHPPALLLANEGTIGDAEQGFVGGVEVSLRKVDVVRGDQGHVVGVGPCDEPGLGGGLAGQAMALDLDIKPIPESLRHLGQGGGAFFRLSRRKQRVDGTLCSAREQDQAFGACCHL